MNSFERMGEAQLLAAEGQRLIAAEVAAFFKRVFDNIFSALGRRSPDAPIL